MNTVYESNARALRDCCKHPAWHVAYESALAGGNALRSHFEKEVNVIEKGIGNYVSDADFAAERAIVEVIQRAFPSHAIISEESHRDRSDASHLWIIDPLDGTNNFLHRIPHFAVSIGYYEHGKPVVAMICNPAIGDWYGATLGQGAWHNGRRVHVNQHDALNQTMVACGFYYDRGSLMQGTLDTIADFFHQHIHGVRRFGAAALDLANLGCGNYGVFFEYQLSPWDYAAGQLFVTEAGGIATDCEGSPLPLDRSSSICVTNGRLHPAALRTIEPHWLPLRAK